MVEKILDFVESLADHSGVRTLSFSELDREARSYHRVTQNQSPSFHS